MLISKNKYNSTGLTKTENKIKVVFLRKKIKLKIGENIIVFDNF